MILAYCPDMDELAGLTEEARRLALDRYRLLQPHLEQNQSLQLVAQAASISPRTWYRLAGRHDPNIAAPTGFPERGSLASASLHGSINFWRIA